MSNSERINKFVEDQTLILTSNQKLSKISSEIDKFRTWLVKHQDDSVPDGSKVKIMIILEKYNRLSAQMHGLRDSIFSLFSDFLQLPEGKLVTSKDKSRVLVWLNNFSDDNDKDVVPPVTSVLSYWTVEAIDSKNHSITLLNESDAELWKENFIFNDEQKFLSICSLYNENNVVRVTMKDDQIIEIS